MAKWTAEKRKDLPKSDFGDPDRSLFPISDQDDVDSAARLIGKAKNPDAVKKRIIAICKRKGLKVPDAWKEDASMSATDGAAGDGASLAVFSNEINKSSEDDNYIIYGNAKLFEAGEYPSHDYEMTPEELWAAVEQFGQPVPIDLEHVPTVLDGKLGEVRSVRLSDDGHSLLGTVAIPRWLDGVLEPGQRKVSAAWDRAAKTLTKLAIVNKPRVADAALMAAFADARPMEADAALEAFFAEAHRTPHGGMALQMIHDTAASCGAVCDPENLIDPGWNGGSTRAAFVSARERSGLQKIHDMSIKHGAKCSIVKGSKSVSMSRTQSQKGAKPMSLKAKFLALFSGGGNPPPEEAVDGFLTELAAVAKAEPAPEPKPVPAPAPPLASFADSPEAKAMMVQIKELQRASTLKDIQTAAVALADDPIKATRVLPNGRPNLVTLFTQMALDDLDHASVVTFSLNEEVKQGSRVDALRAFLASLPTHNLYMNMITDIPDGSAVFAAKGGLHDEKNKARPTDDSVVDAYLAHTAEGRMAIARKNGAK